MLDTGAPTTIISTKLSKRLGFTPNLDYDESFSTAGNQSTQAKGVYSSVPLRFGDLIVTTSSVVLDSQAYDILIGTDFFCRYGAVINMQTGLLSLLDYSVPLLYGDSDSAFLVSKALPPREHLLLKFPHAALGIPYQQYNPSNCPLLQEGYNSKGIPLQANHSV